jgi:predicted Fe-Mo cluster-binding NifX family protein
MKVAVASDNGINLVDKHFGDAKQYYIYEVNEAEIKLLEIIQNPMKDYEEDHNDFRGDKKKAKGIGSILKTKDIKAILAFKIGPNIVNIRKKFVVVLSRKIEINQALNLLRDNISIVEEETKNTGDKEHFIFK